MSGSNRQPFGRTPDGCGVELLTLDNGRLSCQIITFGAALRTLYVPDRTGRPFQGQPVRSLFRGPHTARRRFLRSISTTATIIATVTT